MSPDTANARQGPNPLVQLLFTYATARTVGWLIGFRYNPLSDPFDALKLAVDVALWLFCWIAVGAVLSRVARMTQPAGS